ncbi:T9SS type A sorting domain-containing protein [candidate division KSB1 bacterium]|nr:T9SS type A sorting domain-containing protein [candidate division KSB1 bacterium]
MIKQGGPMCNYRTNSITALALLLFVMIFMQAGASNAAVEVVSSVPSHGDTGVETEVDIQFTFNTALDTTVEFKVPGGVYLGLLIEFGKIGQPDSITLSADEKTVTFHNVELLPETKYVLGVTAAKGKDGSMLEMPWIITFTTAQTLPTGSVSGTLTNTQGNPVGAVTALQKDLFGEDEYFGATVVTNENGQFTIPYVGADSVYVLSAKDLDHDGEFEIFEGREPVAVYDQEGDKIPDMLNVDDGEQITGIDLSLRVAPLQGAKAMAQTATDYAQSLMPAVDLSMIFSDALSNAGTSAFWIYGCFDDSPEEGVLIIASDIYRFQAPLEELFGDDDEDNGDGNGDDGGPPILFDPLPEGWLDSDVAFDSALGYDGQDFLDDYPDGQIFAQLFTLDLGQMQPERLAKLNLDPAWLAAQSADVRTLWVFDFEYEEEDEYLTVVIDALSGEFVPLGSAPTEPILALDNRDTADGAAQAWASDAVLMAITNHQSTVEPGGRAPMWGYIYYSANNDTAQVFIFAEDQLVFAGPFEHMQPGLQPLPAQIIDSDVALTVAENNGGEQYRNAHSDIGIQAGVAKGLNPAYADKAVWQINYYSSDAAPLTIYIDAETGDVLTGVEAEPVLHQPGQYRLYPNYPNPFNPETIITFELPQSGHVDIAVYNTRGRRIKTLAGRYMPAGTYQLIWNGTDAQGKPVVSGVYFCIMRAGGRRQMVKMVLAR